MQTQKHKLGRMFRLGWFLVLAVGVGSMLVLQINGSMCVLQIETPWYALSKRLEAIMVTLLLLLTKTTVVSNPWLCSPPRLHEYECCITLRNMHLFSSSHSRYHISYIFFSDI